MLHIKTFFEKFTRLVPPEKFVKEAVTKGVSRRFGTPLDPGEIKISKNIVYIVVSPALKSEIFTQKQEILSELREELGDKAPRDIR